MSKDQLIITKRDHDIILGYIKVALNRSLMNRQETENLEGELKRAKLVENHLLPEDVVCLNATVMIKEVKEGKVMELTLVTPEKADIKQRKISILSPLASALIGFRKGMKVAWKVPAGLKTFKILDVHKPVVFQ